MLFCWVDYWKIRPLATMQSVKFADSHIEGLYSAITRPSPFFTQLHELRSLRRSFLHFHFISAVHIWFISYIINKLNNNYSLSRGVEWNRRGVYQALSIQPKIPEISVGSSNGTDHFGLVRPEYSGAALKVVHSDRSGHFGRSDRNVPFHLPKLLSLVGLFCILLTRKSSFQWKVKYCE